MSAAIAEPAAARRPRPSGRELALVIVLGLVGGGGLVFAAGRPWRTVAATAITVRQLDNIPYALGLVGLAGTIAVLAAGRYLRPVVGVLIALGGLGAGVAGVLAEGRPADYGTFAYAPISARTLPHETAWPWISLAAAVLLALVGVAVVVRGNRWPGMGRRYEAPGAPTPSVQDPDRAAWQTLDQGGDPTVDAPPPDAPSPDDEPDPSPPEPEPPEQPPVAADEPPPTRES